LLIHAKNLLVLARCLGLDPEHLGHDPLELGLDELGQHHVVCQSLPQPRIQFGRAGIALVLLGVGVGAFGVLLSDLGDGALRQAGGGAVSGASACALP
jgi:hypothetical protein